MSSVVPSEFDNARTGAVRGPSSWYDKRTPSETVSVSRAIGRPPSPWRERGAGPPTASPRRGPAQSGALGVLDARAGRQLRLGLVGGLGQHEVEDDFGEGGVEPLGPDLFGLLLANHRRDQTVPGSVGEVVMQVGVAVDIDLGGQVAMLRG